MYWCLEDFDFVAFYKMLLIGTLYCVSLSSLYGNYFDSRDNFTMSPRGSKANGIVSEEVIAEWANNGMVFK